MPRPVFLCEAGGGYGTAFAVASLHLPLAAGLSLAIDERARPVPRLRPVAEGGPATVTAPGRARPLPAAGRGWGALTGRRDVRA